MLPRLSNVPQLNNVVSDYLSELQKQHFEGDIASNYADCLSLATDNSVYQQLPQAILFPKSVADVNIAQGEPIIAHYRAKGLVHDIEGNQDINDVFSDIEKVLTNLK